MDGIMRRPPAIEKYWQKIKSRQKQLLKLSIFFVPRAVVCSDISNKAIKNLFAMWFNIYIKIKVQACLYWLVLD
ncbi:MAG: hypothetical protein QM768_13975 [Agriterribacter sp.]